MNATQWSNPQPRLACAAVAMLASSLVLSSVLWLFADVSTSPAGVATALVTHQPASPGAHQASSRMATGSSSTVRL